MKRYVLLITTALMTVTLCACSATEPASTSDTISSLVEKIPDNDPTRLAYQDQTDEAEKQTLQIVSDDASESGTVDLDDAVTTEDFADETETPDSSDETSNGFSFADLAGIEFYFSSGAGAWATSLNVESDGGFSGIFSDSDMGITGDGYPGGTIHYCAYSGKFTQPEKIDDYTYVVRIQEISYEYEEGTQEIKDEVLYNYTYPYGLEDAEDLYIYLPGKSTQDFSDGLTSWLRFGIDTETGTLTEYAINNVEKEEAFLGHNI